MKKLLRFKNNDKGQSMVEFAIVLPILMLLVVGIIQFGLIFNVKITLANQAREAVRYSAVGGYSDNDVKNKVNNSLKENSLLAKYVENGKLKINVLPNIETRTDQVTVKITIDKFDLIVKKDTYLLSESATMRIETQINGDGGSNNGGGNIDPIPNDSLKTFANIYKILDDNTPISAADPKFPYFNVNNWRKEYGSYFVDGENLYSDLKAEYNDTLKIFLKMNYGVDFDENRWNQFKGYYDG